MLDELNSTFMQGEVTTIYYGSVNEKTISSLSDNVRAKEKLNTEQKKIGMKVFSGFIEIIMNILHHSPVDENNPQGLIVLGKDNDYYFVASGNKIKVSQKEDIRNKVEPITKMSPEEIHAAYWKQLRDPENEQEDSKGASLGILTLAKESAKPISYFFKKIPLDSEHEIFFIKAEFK